MAQLTGDKSYSSRANQAAPQPRRIPDTIPSATTRKQTGPAAAPMAAGLRPSAETYKLRNQVER